MSEGFATSAGVPMPEHQPSHEERNEAAARTADDMADAVAAAEAAAQRVEHHRGEEQEQVRTLANGKTEAVVAGGQHMISEPPAPAEPPLGDGMVNCFGCLHHYNVLDADERGFHGRHKATTAVPVATLQKWLTTAQAQRDEAMAAAAAVPALGDEEGNGE